MPGGGAGKRRFRAWGLLAVAGLVAGLVGLATLSGSADGQVQPATPTNLVINVITETSATLTWRAGTGGCAITTYYVKLLDSTNATFKSGEISPPEALTWTVTGLNSGTTYSLSVTPYSDSCGVEYGATTSLKYFTTLGATPTPTSTPTPPPGSAPDEPTNFRATGITDTGVTLSWTAVPDGVCATYGYAIFIDEWDIDNDGDNAWYSGVIKTTTVTVTGRLEPGVKYEPYIATFSRHCETAYSDDVYIVFTTTGVAAEPTRPPTARPNPPTGVTASSVTNTTAVLSWTAGADGHCPPSKYHVDVGIPRLATIETFIWDQNVFAGTTVTATGLNAGTRYLAFVAVFSEECNKWGSSKARVEFTTKATPLTISVSDVSVAEGDSGGTAMNFTVTLSGSPSHDVTIRATSRGVGMAAAPGRTPPTAMGTGYGRDFDQFSNRAIVFAAGATGAALTKTVTVNVIGDEFDEDDETLILRLNNLTTEATNVSFAGGETRLEATGTITDDDDGATPRVISASDVSVAEGNEGRTELTFTITLSATPSHDVAIRATVRGDAIRATLASPPTAKGTAGEGRDFIRFSNRNIVFAAGATGAELTQTVTVVVLGDTVVEDHETLSLRLNNLRTSDGLVQFTGGAKRLFVTGTITNDDAN